MKVRPGRIALGAAGALLALAPIALLAQSEDRRRAVGDWLVEDVAEQDGTRSVQIRREDGDYALDYHLWLRPGATQVESHGFLVTRLNCGAGVEETTGGNDDTPIEAAAVRARLVDYLDRCQAPAADKAALLEGFERAFQLAGEWAAERVAELAAAEPTDMGAMAMDANMNDMSMDSNMADMDMMDMNASDVMDAGFSDMNATATDTNSITDTTGEPQ